MSDSTVSISKSYWNGELVGNVNMIYRELINIDPDDVPYIKKASPTSFFWKTRKWYVWNIIPPYLSEWTTYNNTTDIVKIDTTWCGDGDCYYLYYQVNDDGSRYRVIRRNCDDCETMTLVQEWYRCQCDSDKFVEIDYPIWDVIKEWKWDQSIVDLVEYRFTDTTFVPVADWWDVQVGDYIVFYESTDSVNPWQCWIYRQINGVFDGYITLDTWYEEWFANPEQTETIDWWIGSHVSYKIFRNIWPTAMRVGWMSLNVYHWQTNEVSIMCWSRWGCLLSVVKHNNIINVLTQQWYNSYGGIWENLLYFVGTNTYQVWTDKTSSISFGSFLVVAGRNSIIAMVFDENWQYSYAYDVWETSYPNFGIYSKNAMSVFDNWLYVIWNDKRLHSASIEWSWEKYYLKLTPVDWIFHELDLLQDWDDASISSYQNKLYIFINGRFDVDDYMLNKTKILIYNKDYKIRYTHIIPRWVINQCKYWLFLWDGLFQYVWDRDVYTLWTEDDNYIHTSPIKAEIVFDIVNSENHDIVNGLGNRVSLMTYKKLNRMKMLLWPGKYTDNTYIDIDTYTGWYKFTKRLVWFESNWIDNQNEYYDGNYENISVSPCFSEMLSKCDNMNNKCDWSHANTDVREELNSPVCHWSWTDVDIRYDSKKFDDYAICYNEKGYQLSPIQDIYINPQIKYEAILFTIHIVSDNYDRINFGWAVVEYDSYPIWYKQKTSFDINPECCNVEKKCVNKNCA